jgi:hypothetical protein
VADPAVGPSHYSDGFVSVDFHWRGVAAVRCQPAGFVPSVSAKPGMCVGGAPGSNPDRLRATRPLNALPARSGMRAVAGGTRICGSHRIHAVCDDVHGLRDLPSLRTFIASSSAATNMYRPLAESPRRIDSSHEPLPSC